jgi:hypothetical protein
MGGSASFDHRPAPTVAPRRLTDIGARHPIPEIIMYPSSQLCQAQEKIQLERAHGAQLPNVRLIAETAATLWRLEGISARKRERKQSAMLAKRAIAEAHAIACKPDPEDQRFSENPDRGFATESPGAEQSTPLSSC